MSRTELEVKISRANGHFAELDACLGDRRRGWPRAAGLALLALALLGIFLFALTPSPASADSRIGSTGELTSEQVAAGGIASPTGLAVSDSEAGDLYLADAGNQRVDQFHPDGTFVRAFGWGVLNGAAEPQVCTTATGCRGGSTGSGAGQLDYSEGIAVDNDSNSESYGDLYVVDRQNFRVEKYDSEGHFLLMFGGEVDKTTGANVCTAEDIEVHHDICGAGLPGTGPSHFYHSGSLSWGEVGNNSIAVGPGGTVYVGDYGRIQEFDLSGASIGERAFPLEQFVTSLAVASSGQVYAGSRAIDEAQRVNPPSSGTYTLTFKGQTTSPLPFNLSGHECPPSEPGCLTVQKALEALSTIGADNVRVENGPGVKFVGALANANLPPLSVSVGSVETTTEGATPRLVELGPSGEVLQTFDTEPGSEPTHIALDSAGDLFVSDPNGERAEPPSGKFVFRAFKPTGVLYAEIASDQVTGQRINANTTRPAANDGIALGDAEGKLYASSDAVADSEDVDGNSVEHYIAVIPLPEPGPPIVSEERATDVKPKTTTLRGLVNPAEFDTKYHFEYGTTTAYGQPTPTEELGLVYRNDPAQAAISGLTVSTLYHYRLVAESNRNGGETVYGPDQTFETLPPVSVRDFTTQTVGPELLTLKAELNSNGPQSHYTIRYGTDAAYGCEAGNTCTASGDLPVGNEFVKVEKGGKEGVTFTGLKPNTTYHYQLLAENEYGTIITPDRTFSTEPAAAEERAAEDCPANGTVHGEAHSTLREENNSLALPDCRAYEQTTELVKEGGEAFADHSLAPAGERVLYTSEGVFAGALQNEASVLYLAQRTPSGWVTQPVISHRSPPGIEPQITAVQLFFSPELDRWLYGEVPALSHLEGFFRGKTAYLSMGFADGTYLLHASPTYSLLEGEGRRFFQIFNTNDTLLADDLSTIYVVGSTRFLPTDPRPDDFVNSITEGLMAGHGYRLSGLGTGAADLSLFAAVPLELETGKGCGLDTDAFGGKLFQHSEERLVSADGSTMIYVAPIQEVPHASCGAGTPNPFALFAYHDGASVRLNVPPDSQCAPSSPCHAAPPADPTVDGISPDGSRVWFTTTQPLIDSDTDNTADLYLAKLQGGQPTGLVQASAGEAGPAHPTPGNGADVRGVLRVSPGGSHVSFVANGVLTTHPNQSTGEAAAQGADNLYVYDAAAAETKFIARLCSGPAQSGSLADSACPAGLDGNQHGGHNDSTLWFAEKHNPVPADFTPDGRYLIFLAHGRLTSDDTDSASDAYRYDFQTGQLLRLSFGRDGNDGDGNDDAYPAEIQQLTQGMFAAGNNLAEDSTRSISADGSLVIFATAAPLVSHDTNEAPDVYQWEEAGRGGCQEAGGCISLISDGLDPNGARHGVISSSGRDITFHTNRDEVPADTDGVGDLYDARIGGGFHYSPPEKPCEGPETCLPLATPPPAPPRITTENETGGNGPTRLECGKGRHRVKKHGQVRCVANKSHKAKKHHKAKHKGAARANRGGNK